MAGVCDATHTPQVGGTADSPEAHLPSLLLLQLRGPHFGPPLAVVLKGSVRGSCSLLMGVVVDQSLLAAGPLWP